jgi:hypothetical protein
LPRAWHPFWLCGQFISCIPQVNTFTQ